MEVVSFAHCCSKETVVSDSVFKQDESSNEKPMIQSERELTIFIFLVLLNLTHKGRKNFRQALDFSSKVYSALGFKRKGRGGNVRKGQRKNHSAIPVFLCRSLCSLRLFCAGVLTQRARRQCTQRPRRKNHSVIPVFLCGPLCALRLFCSGF